MVTVIAGIIFMALVGIGAGMAIWTFVGPWEKAWTNKQLEEFRRSENTIYTSEHWPEWVQEAYTRVLSAMKLNAPLAVKCYCYNCGEDGVDIQLKQSLGSSVYDHMELTLLSNSRSALKTNPMGPVSETFIEPRPMSRKAFESMNVYNAETLQERHCDECGVKVVTNTSNNQASHIICKQCREFQIPIQLDMSIYAKKSESAKERDERIEELTEELIRVDPDDERMTPMHFEYYTFLCNELTTLKDQKDKAERRRHEVYADEGRCPECQGHMSLDDRRWITRPGSNGVVMCCVMCTEAIATQRMRPIGY